jgi:hypothetical protein
MEELVSIDAEKIMIASEKILDALEGVEEPRVMASALGLAVGAIALASGVPSAVLQTVDAMARATVDGKLFKRP